VRGAECENCVMTRKSSQTDHAAAYAELVALLEKNLKFIVSVGLDEKRAAHYQALLAYLRSRSKKEIEEILLQHNGDASKKAPRKLETPKHDDLSDGEILQMGAVALGERLRSGQMPRTALERIAKVRFSMTTGALSVLRSRGALQEKLLNLLSNEATHKAIERVAEGSQRDNPDDR
jgi:hypothetical protein